MADLITRTEYKALQGIQPADTRRDAQIDALLPAASRAVRSYTGRNFDVSGGTATTRTFQHDGSEMLDIDDAVTVVSLATDAGVPGQLYDLTSDQWVAMPQDDSDVYYYILVLGGPYFGVSPEMGFERNLDRYDLHVRNPLISVTATWGWPEIPADVKLATAITISEFLGAQSSGGGSEGLTAEAIEGWSRAWGARGGGAMALAIPNRARDLLVNYQRILV